jgi:calcium-dependent protein kinase
MANTGVEVVNQFTNKHHHQDALAKHDHPTLIMPTTSSQIRVLPFECTPCIGDRYRFDELLGEGSSCSTYKCFNILTNRPYACKVVPKHDNAEFNVESLQTEIRMLIKLVGHPNIVTLHEVYEDDYRVCIVMDLCSGGELYTRISERRPSGHSEREAADIMYQIMRGLQTCHSIGIAHLDVKPENLLISFDDTKVVEDPPTIKLIDFGLSRFVRRGEDVQGNIVGTKLYVSPEVLQQRYGCEADVWSAGCILFVLLSGTHPFEHLGHKSDRNHMRELADAQVEFERDRFLRPSTQVWGTISPSAKDLVSKMLRVDPRQRLTVAEFFKHPWTLCHMKSHMKSLWSAMTVKKYLCCGTSS